MAIFRRQLASHGTAIRAAAGVANGQIGSFLGYQVGTVEERALSIPTIARSRSMICTMIAGLDLKMYTRQWTGEEYEKIYTPTPAWCDRPDPKVTRQFIMANTVSDLLMYGRAFWYITSRDANTGLPASFTWLPSGSVSTPNQQGPQWWGMPDEVEFNGVLIPLENVVTFIAADQGMVYTGARAIDIAIRLDAAARRFALTEVAAGYLQQTDGTEPMDSESLGELASAWATARRESAIGALNNAVKFVEFSQDPAKLQLTEARNHAALEMSRIAGVPAYLVSAPTSNGMVYQNAQMARQDLWLWGAAPYAKTIAETLSLPQIVGPGRSIEFDIDELLKMTELGSGDEPRTEDSEQIPNGANA